MSGSQADDHDEKHYSYHSNLDRWNCLGILHFGILWRIYYFIRIAMVRLWLFIDSGLFGSIWFLPVELQFRLIRLLDILIQWSTPLKIRLPKILEEVRLLWWNRAAVRGGRVCDKVNLHFECYKYDWYSLITDYKGSWRKDSKHIHQWNIFKLGQERVLQKFRDRVSISWIFLKAVQDEIFSLVTYLGYLRKFDLIFNLI